MKWRRFIPHILLFFGGLASVFRVPRPPRRPLGPASRLAPETRRPRPRYCGRGTPSSGRHPANLQPLWLTIPERDLYTGVAIFGAVGLAALGRKVDLLERSNGTPGRVGLTAAMQRTLSAECPRVVCCGK